MANRIDDMTVRQIRDAAGIVDVVSDFYELRKAGQNYTCLCPFHDDRHVGSFFVSPKRNTFHCFACGAKGGPVDFIMRHERLGYRDALLWLARKYSIEVKDEDTSRFASVKPSKPKAIVESHLPMLTLPLSYVGARLNTSDDTLCNWLRSLPWSDEQRQRIPTVLRQYAVGHARQGHTIFWQIDELGQVRTGKMMLYKADGHRDRGTKGNFHWIHNLLNRAGMVDLEKTEYVTTLFGMHLLDFAPEAQVNIVESEKTALLCAIYWGGMERNLWMACGGMTFLNRERLKPIIERGRTVMLFPDKDGVERWKELSEAIGYGGMKVSTQYLDTWWTEDDGTKADLGDIIVHNLTAPVASAPAPCPVAATTIPPKRVTAADVLEAMRGENPAVGELVDRLGLEIL